MATHQSAPRALAAWPVFAGLSAEELAELQAISTVAHYAPASTIFPENQLAPDLPAGDALYAVLGGPPEGPVPVEVRIKDRRDGARTLATLGPGAVLGEMSLLTRDTYSASAVATAETTARRLPAAAFGSLLQPGKRSAYQVVYNFSQVAVNWHRTFRRLREVNQRLVARLADQDETAAPQRIPEGPAPEELVGLKRKLFSAGRSGAKWQFEHRSPRAGPARLRGGRRPASARRRRVAPHAARPGG